MQRETSLGIISCNNHKHRGSNNKGGPQYSNAFPQQSTAPRGTDRRYTRLRTSDRGRNFVRKQLSRGRWEIFESRWRNKLQRCPACPQTLQTLLRSTHTYTTHYSRCEPNDHRGYTDEDPDKNQLANWTHFRGTNFVNDPCPRVLRGTAPQKLCLASKSVRFFLIKFPAAC